MSHQRNEFNSNLIKRQKTNSRKKVDI